MRLKKANKTAKGLIQDEEPNAATLQEEYNVKIAECIKTMRSLRDDLWGLFEHLLDAFLVPDWQTIVKKETTEDGWIAKGGVRQMGK